MPTRDLHSHIKAVLHVAAQAITATNTPSTGVDLAGFDSAEFLISLGTISNIAGSPTPSWTFKLQDSDTSNASFVDVTDASLVLVGSAKTPVTAPDSSTGVFLTVDAASEDAAVYRVGYVGKKRYVRVVATASAEAPGSTPYSVIAILGNPALKPTAD
jgi:hypothetical protein